MNGLILISSPSIVQYLPVYPCLYCWSYEVHSLLISWVFICSSIGKCQVVYIENILLLCTKRLITKFTYSLVIMHVSSATKYRTETTH